MAMDEEAQLLSREYEPDKYVLPGSSICSIVMLPFRIAAWLLLMCTILPLWLTIALVVAILKRISLGRPSQILKTGSKGFSIPGMYYPAFMLFSEPFEEEKLRKVFLEMGKECGLGEDKMRLTMEKEVPSPLFAPSGGIEMDHYVEKGTNWLREHSAKHYPASISTTGMGRGHVCWLRVFNGAKGKPTVINVGLDGNRWDGSSCFNFMKELTHRYTTGQKHDVFKGDKLLINPESAKKLDEGNFLVFLCLMVYRIVMNAATTFWNCWKSAALCGGGAGCSPFMALTNFDANLCKFALINFSKEDSAKLAAGCKKLGIKPFAAMTYSAVHAWKKVKGYMPHTMIQECSLQTRHFPDEAQVGRDLVGDWLVGPLQYPTATYTLKDAQAGYENLLSELDQCGPSVRDAFWAKAYGVLSSGAAVFQLPFWHPADSRLSESIFFNNYGIRTVDEKSAFYSWNWGAPFGFGWNTISVNGTTTITCASSFLGIDVLRAVRDQGETTLRLIMDGVNPDEMVL